MLTYGGFVQSTSRQKQVSYFFPLKQCSYDGPLQKIDSLGMFLNDLNLSCFIRGSEWNFEKRFSTQNLLFNIKKLLYEITYTDL